jgi:hypothetical protein
MFLDDWKRHYPSCEPFSWRALEVHADLWFRIHSLPESKRYAESDEEYRLLLKRHNELAEAVLGNGTQCWLSWYGQEQADRFIGTRVCEYSEEWIETTIYAVQIIWRTGYFDSFIQRVADEELSGSIFMDCLSGDVYAPYDGGADVFIHEPRKREAIQKRFEAWLSPRKDGL